MNLVKNSVKKEQLTDNELLFYAKIVRTGMTDVERSNPEKYVELINSLSVNKYTTLDQVLSVIPSFIVQIEEEDRRLQYKNLGL